MLMFRARSEFASSCVARAPESPVPARPETTPIPTTSLSSIPRTPTRLRTWEKTRELKSRPTRAVFPRRGRVVYVALDLPVGCVGAWIEGTGVTIVPTSDCALAAAPTAGCVPATGGLGGRGLRRLGLALLDEERRGEDEGNHRATWAWLERGARGSEGPDPVDGAVDQLERPRRRFEFVIGPVPV